MLDGGPGDGIFSGGEWRSLVGEVGQDVSLDAGRNGVGGGGDEAMEERGVGGVGKGVAAGLDGVAGVEVAIGQGALRVVRLAGDVLAAAGRGLGVGVGCGGGGCGRPGRRRRCKADEGLVQAFAGANDAVEVLVFRDGGGAFDGDQLERAYFGKEEEQAGERVGADAGGRLALWGPRGRHGGGSGRGRGGDGRSH